MSLKTLTLSLAIVLILSVTLFGQSKSIAGRVVDSAQAAIPSATVALKNRRTGLERIAATDEDGRFTFAGLSSDEYEVSTTASGFAPFSRSVAAGETNILLTLDVATIREAVTVTSGSRQTELQDQLNTAVEVVTRKQIEEKGYQTVGDVLKEVPGVLTRLGTDTGTVSGIAGEQIQGVGSRQALVLIDGFPVISARGIKSGTISIANRRTRLNRSRL
jgi:hypothetical protein